MSYSRNVSTTLRFAPTPSYPLSGQIHDLVFRGHMKNRQSLQSGIVSPELCDDILNRLSPFLHRNKPLDILDLWPGCGLLSTKVNEYLQPRRHVLIEQDYNEYKPLLGPLAKSKPCYKLLSMNPYLITNWAELFAEHLPEQKLPDQVDGQLPRNDTLLVLANPPEPYSVKDHYTPARWWSVTMENCLAQKGLHCYGSVRIMASISLSDSERIVPRTIVERKRPAIVTENVAAHMFEVAKTREIESWVAYKSTDLIKRNFERVTEREKAQGIITPPSRTQPPYQMAIKSPRPGRAAIAHQPRLATEYLQRLYKIIAGHTRNILRPVTATELSDATKPTDKAKYLKWNRAFAELNRDNLFFFTRATISEKQADLERKVRCLSQAAADPSVDLKQLEAYDQEVAASQNDLTEYMANLHYRLYRCYDHTVDDDRNDVRSNNFDDSCLLYDRRPFEPLHTSQDEIYPHLDRAVVYFEAGTTPIAFQKIQQVPAEKREQLLELFQAYTMILGTRSEMSVTDFLVSIFPETSINDIVSAIPGLASYATKRLKTGSGPIPLADGMDPHSSFQENLDYDLSGTRIRLLPVGILWDIIIEYQKRAVDEISARRLTRLLGGTLTAFRAGESVGQPGKKSVK
ncbi:hypothetical protein N7495_009453 [Penicillium taxi]|uniref:uncharacterized protein n=1 Tax=Penicillium taxi TaxID=168475 RepID=UPI0025454B5F|nr:uncharacterized protein N7495_009453 [Penicillium taxi]KAJ5884943.1 hypothetical protein N7495_009453 [Penicillium taxi]